jgi:hypothetical protein
VSVVSAHADSRCEETQGTRLDNHAAWLRKHLPSSCGQLTRDGACSRGNALWCENGQEVKADCAAQGKTCARDACGQVRCVTAPPTPEPPCDKLDYFGRCNAGVLEWCLHGKLQRRDCERLGRTCGRSPDPLVGFTCLGDQRDGGSADAGADLGGDGGSPGALTCSRLDSCLKQAGDDFWAQRRCCYPYPYKVKRAWAELYACQVCAAASSAGCKTTAPYYLKCSTPCRDATSAACKACLDTTCKTFHDACHKP